MMARSWQASWRPFGVVAALLAASVGAEGVAQSAEDPAFLVRDLTHQTPERSGPGYAGCGETSRDRLVARSLAQLGQTAVPAIEQALESIEHDGEKSRFSRGAFWVLASYAKIEGAAGEARLRRMAFERKLAFLTDDIDPAIALAQSITSHVSESQTLGNFVDCTRSREPRHALDQFVLAWERGDRRWFEASLGPHAKAAFKELLKGRSWAKMRIRFWKNRPVRGVALGYQFNNAGVWGEPWETLEADRQYAPVSFDPRSPRIETSFKTDSGRDCGTAWVELVPRALADSVGEAAYLVDNADLSDLLRTITSCVTPAKSAGSLGATIGINTGMFASYDPTEVVSQIASTILEELGHAYNLVPGSGGSQVVYDGSGAQPVQTPTEPESPSTHEANPEAKTGTETSNPGAETRDGDLKNPESK